MATITTTTGVYKTADDMEPATIRDQIAAGEPVDVKVELNGRTQTRPMIFTEAYVVAIQGAGT